MVSTMRCSQARASRLAILAFVLAGAPLFAAQAQGVTAEWDVRSTLTSLAQQTAQLKPVLENISPKAWVEKGASEAYVGQLDSLKTQIEGVVSSCQALAQKPEKLSAALDTLFRLQSFELILNSFADGLRRYQNPELARLLIDLANTSSDSVDRLRQYCRELAAAQEAEFAVVDQEAQRCRAQMLRQSSGKPSGRN